MKIIINDGIKAHKIKLPNLFNNVILRRIIAKKINLDGKTIIKVFKAIKQYKSDFKEIPIISVISGSTKVDIYY